MLKSLLFLFITALPQKEVLTYDMYLGSILAGTMKLSLIHTEYEGIPCYRLRSVLNSSPGAEWLFTLNDTLYSYVAKDDFRTLYFEKHMHETNYDTVIKVYYDWDNNEVRYEDGTTYPLEDGTLDIVSIYYSFRLDPLENGEGRRAVLHADRLTEEATVEAVKETWVRSSASPEGRFWCTKLVPDVEGKGSFGAGGNLIFYLTTDEHHVPALIKTHMSLLTINARLKWVWRE